MIDMENNPGQRGILVWDLPTRLFHWSLVGCLAGSWISHEMKASGFWLHQLFGYTALALVLWRVGWGFAGTRYARFDSFLRGPGAVLRYLRGSLSGQVSAPLGHNPAGGWAVAVMLALVAFQCLSGVFNGGELLMEGPWHHVLEKDWKRWVREAHELAFNLLVAMVALHLAAILYYRLRHGQRLAVAMIHGYRQGPREAGTGIAGYSAWRAVLLAALAAGLVWALVAAAPAPTLESLDIF